MKEITIATWNALPAICRRTNNDGTRHALVNGQWTEIKLVKAKHVMKV